MIIGFVLDDSLDKPDGVQQAVITSGEWLRSKGHEVHYLVGRTDRTDLKNVHSLAKTLRVKFNGNTMGTPLPTSTKLLKQFLAGHKFDVLHVQMPYSPFFAAKIVNLALPTTKVVGTFHILPFGKINTLATKQLAKLLKKSLKRFNTFISVSEPAAKFAKASFGINSIVIPNPVDTAKFKVSKHPNAKLKRIVYLGRLEERKGALQLVEAYRELLTNDPKLIRSTSLVIGGKGPLHDAIKKNLNSLPSGSNFELLGFVPDQDKANLLASADVAVFPSISGESFGIVLVEAMSAGSKLIIAGNNPGYSSVLGEKPELLFDPRDKLAFAKKLAWGLSYGADAKELSQWLKSQAVRYDIDSVGHQLLDVYQS